MTKLPKMPSSVRLKIAAVKKLFTDAPDEFLATPTPIFLAFILLIITSVFIVLTWGRTDAVILVIVCGNSLMQMCIDFFPGDSKPVFSAIARIIPVLVAIAAYFSMLHP